MAKKDIKHNRLNVDRANQIRRDNDKIQDVNTGLYDIDETVKYYFDEVVKLQITDSSGNIAKVPVQYATPENWKSIQASEIKRNRRGKIQLPFLVFRRDSITKDRNLGNKVDANNPLYTTVEQRYNLDNRYDRFNILNNRLQGKKPVRILQKIVVPDYITVTYSCIVYTEFLTQMNSIIEAISYGEGTYWGDKNKYMVRAKIDDFPSTVELDIGKDRVVKSEFQITINGHILPKTIQQQAALGSAKTYTAAKIVMGESIVTDINSVGIKPANIIDSKDGKE